MPTDTPVKTSSFLLLPPRRPRREPTWRCWLLGCIFEWVRLDAWWEVDQCRWCGDIRKSRVAPERTCLRCGQAMPDRSSVGYGAPPPPDPRQDPGRCG